MNVFLGICEDNDSDPLKMGRIKIRIFGVHTDNRVAEEDYKKLTVDELPWAIPAYPPNTQTIDGMCDFQVPKKGSNILVCFLDNDQQQPIYFGTVPKIPKKLPDWNKGFSDPDKKHPESEYLNESPISRLARNEKINQTIIQEKRDSIKTGVVCATTSWDEEKTKYNTKYAKNRVIETESGHYIELDDTKGAERVHIYHKKDTSIELHPNGTRVDRINNKKFTIVLNDDNILIEGNQNIHINIDNNRTIENDQNTVIGNDKNSEIGNDKKYQISNNEDETVGNNSTTTVGNTITRSAGNVINITAGTLVKITAPRVHIN